MMVCCCSQNLRDGFQAFLRNYDRLQHIAIILIYLQIGCALIGSLGALYNGVLLINLGIALFALVAIESGNQTLGRTYAVLLFCAILLDISWFILFSHDIWNMSSNNEDHGIFYVFSVRLTMAMEIIGFCLRFCSSLLWIQIYRQGVSYVDSSGGPRDADFDLRNSFLNPTTPCSNSLFRQCSQNDSDDALGGAIYDPAYYSSLFADRQQKGSSYLGQNDSNDGRGTGAEASQLKPSPITTLQAIDEEDVTKVPQIV